MFKPQHTLFKYLAVIAAAAGFLIFERGCHEFFVVAQKHLQGGLVHFCALFGVAFELRSGDRAGVDQVEHRVLSASVLNSSVPVV